MSNGGNDNGNDDGGGGQRLLLLVETHEDTRRTVTRILQQDGYEVIAVGLGTHALGAARSVVVGLAVVDTAIADVPLGEFVARLRAATATPIVFTSANVLPADLESYAALGLGPVLPKPYSIGALHAAIANARWRASRRPVVGGGPHLTGGGYAPFN